MERRHSQSQLRRHEAYLEEAQRLSRTGSFGWNVATGELVWSAETFRIMGYEPQSNRLWSGCSSGFTRMTKDL